MDFKKYNKYIGWALFAIAAICYLATMERSVSLWDCGEYIATSNKLEVGHPPGAPLFQMINRLLTAFVPGSSVALVVNAVSALSSAFTILFLFWTITAIGQKMAKSKISLFIKGDDSVIDDAKSSDNSVTDGQHWAILGSGIIGALVYTFTDSFWFSAVEAEVYAMSSFFTALVFWAMYKWDQQMDKFEAGETKRNPDYWLVFILFMVGLSIGVHLLNLLAIPAMAYIYYFRKFKKPTIIGFMATGIISYVVLSFIQDIIIPGTAKWIAGLEILFVNDMGMPFGSGMIFFFLLLVSILTGGIWYSKKRDWVNVNTVFVSLTVLYIGYSCFAMIPIRSNADLPIDENNPENPVSLESYLLREQYGDRPLFSGPQFTSGPGRKNPSEFGDKSPIYVRAFVIKKGDEQIKGFPTEKAAKKYIKEKELKGVEIEEEYYKSSDRKNVKPTYHSEVEVLFPRMYSMEDRHVQEYKNWTSYPNNPADPALQRDYVDLKQYGKGKVYMPTGSENREFFWKYQFNHMFFRYFMWNFAGRQNDDHNQKGDITIGNWQTGLNFIDKEFLGDQSTLPEHRKNNYANNKYYLLPLILGLIGLFYHAYRNWKDWFVVFVLFLFTGFMVIIYLNQKPLEPRERDYAYAAAFYTFSIWIGLSVYAIYDLARHIDWKKYASIMAWPLGAGVLLLAIETMGDDIHVTSYSILYMTAVTGAVIALFMFLRDRLNDGKKQAIAITSLLAVVPLLMAFQNWNDHDRSGRYTPREMAKNYLKPCAEQAIMFTNGDNDTFPLWYIQEVENYRTDVRTVNLSLANTDWYIEQMTRRAWKSDPLPISMEEHEYMEGAHLDQVFMPSGMLNYYLSEADQSVKSGKAIDQTVIDAFTEVCKHSPSVVRPYLDMQWQTKSGVVEPLKRFKGVVNTALAANGGMDEPANLAEKIDQLSSGVWQVSNPSLSGESITYMPYKRFFIPVSDEAKDKLIEDKAIPENVHEELLDSVIFSVGKGYIHKADLLILDLVSQSNWERPIYFAATGGKEAYLGLQKHFQMEGLVYRLVPYRTENPTYRRYNIFGNVYADKMYDVAVNQWEWGNLKGDNINVDYYNRRPVSNFRLQYSVLAEALCAEGKYEMAKKALDKSMEEFPDNKIPFDNFTTVALEAYLKVADGLYGDGKTDLGKQARDKAEFIAERLNKYSSDDFKHFSGFKWRFFSHGKSLDDVAFQFRYGFGSLDAIANSYKRHEANDNAELAQYYAQMAKGYEAKRDEYISGFLTALNTKLGEMYDNYDSEEYPAQQNHFYNVADGFFSSMSEMALGDLPMKAAQLANARKTVNDLDPSDQQLLADYKSRYSHIAKALMGVYKEALRVDLKKYIQRDPQPSKEEVEALRRKQQLGQLMGWLGFK